MRATPPPPSLRAFADFLGPMILTNLLQVLSGTLNSIFLGRMLGFEALAVSGSYFPILFFLVSFVIGVGSGASVLIGRAHGAGNRERIRAVAGAAIAATVVGGAIVALAGVLFVDDALRALGTPASILPAAVDFARVSLVGSPLLFLVLLMSALLRGVGDTRTTLATLALMSFVNLVATPALILMFGASPRLAMLSAAYAGIAASAIGLGWMALSMRRAGHVLAIDAQLQPYLTIHVSTLRDILHLGIPTAVQVMLLSFAEVAILSLVNKHGAVAVAAYGAVNQIVAYVQFPAISIAITASILGAHAVGAARPQHLRPIVRTAMLLNALVTGALVVLVLACARAVIGLFVADQAVVALAQSILNLTLWGYVLFGAAGVLVAIMRATGVVWAPTFISMFVIVGIEVPVAYAINAPLGLAGLWLAIPVAFSALLLLQWLYYRLIWSRGGGWQTT